MLIAISIMETGDSARWDPETACIQTYNVIRSQDPGHTGATVHGDAQEECSLGLLGRGSLLLDAQRILGLLRQGAEGQVSRAQPITGLYSDY